ncbi:hypothetical protein [Nocardiopsis sp. YSL2]|uniref:hypothetical protein n=1 Tax=Nocardiopsis sp. YSL2 TaxID=2939492 RepID=UPI0026F43771|nr:hypothetical protein [Nocardiopsis sp. YSL2]
MWVRRRDPSQKHECDLPTREVTWKLPVPADGSASTLPDSHTETLADGDQGDLWRCDTCRALWRLGDACDWCDRYGYHDRGVCTIGLRWRPATLWQRVRHRGR